jgi:hypothetical protein
VPRALLIADQQYEVQEPSDHEGSDVARGEPMLLDVPGARAAHAVALFEQRADVPPRTLLLTYHPERVVHAPPAPPLAASSASFDASQPPPAPPSAAPARAPNWDDIFPLLAALIGDEKAQRVRRECSVAVIGAASSYVGFRLISAFVPHVAAEKDGVQEYHGILRRDALPVAYIGGSEINYSKRGNQRGILARVIYQTKGSKYMAQIVHERGDHHCELVPVDLARIVGSTTAETAFISDEQLIEKLQDALTHTKTHRRSSSPALDPAAVAAAAAAAAAARTRPRQTSPARYVLLRFRVT